MLQIVLLFVLFQSVIGEESYNIPELKQSYETNLNFSIQLDREGKSLINSWMADYEVKRINIITKYRMQMAKHKEHCFKSANNNPKWKECVFLNHRQIRKSEREYRNDETQCLMKSTTEDRNRTKAAEQVEKEIRKWRKSYRYLVNTCNIENPNDKDASDECLVQYMEADHYNNVIQRLMDLQLKAMKEIYSQLVKSSNDLEGCINKNLSKYLEKVRLIMDTLNKCYSLTTHGKESQETREGDENS